ncbi:MAG TPA: hypothetical protein VG033_04360 [Candidatus Acidoferrales bacterium]|jgi:hypothetical protein|nr:hypothetical protein [Candidatus Acidoferrales bacterium]
MTQLIENKNPALILIANKNGFFGQKMEGLLAGAQIHLILELRRGVYVLL